MNAKSWLKTAKKQIDVLDAELILCHVLGFADRSALATHDKVNLTRRQLRCADRLARQRRHGVPLAYLTGYKEFYGRRFAVSRRVLIPRPESEAIIRLALGLKPAPRRVLDVGTGSGCLALTLSAELGEAVEITATDKSIRTVLFAVKNARHIFGDDVKNRPLTFQNGNLLQNITKPASFDLVVANLPYVDKSWDWLDQKSLKAEPRHALYAGDHGLALIKSLIRQMKSKRMKCHLILEADPSQHAAIIEYAQGYGFEFVKKDDFALLFRRGI